MKTRRVSIFDGWVYNEDLDEPVICWKHAAEQAANEDAPNHPCNIACAALDVDNVRGPRCLMMPHLMSFGMWQKEEG
jgi:hypothetical protein